MRIGLMRRYDVLRMQPPQCIPPAYAASEVLHSSGDSTLSSQYRVWHSVTEGCSTTTIRSNRYLRQEALGSSRASPRLLPGWS